MQTKRVLLLNFSFPAQKAALDFVLSGAVSLVPSSVDSLTFVKRMMAKYQDLPMDFADATLVSAAYDLMINNILTFDKKHFSTYRLHKKECFTVYP